jgi:putative addiction module killer protein
LALHFDDGGVSPGIQLYVGRDGRVLFAQWLNFLKDRRARAKIRVRLDRVRLGNLGDHRALGEGLWELRIDYGPGYRVYFGQVGTRIVLLLGGG